MQISIFAKNRTTKEGKNFVSYLSRLKKKDGTEVPVTVKFREADCKPVPQADCPCMIDVDKSCSSLSSQKFENEKGEPGIGYTLWVGGWEYAGEFEDHSLDDFED